MPEIRIYTNDTGTGGGAWYPLLDPQFLQFDDPETADEALAKLLHHNSCKILRERYPDNQAVCPALLAQDYQHDHLLGPRTTGFPLPGCIVVAAQTGFHFYNSPSPPSSVSTPFTRVLGSWCEVAIVVVGDAESAEAECRLVKARRQLTFHSMPKVPRDTLHSGVVITGTVLSRLG